MRPRALTPSLYPFPPPAQAHPPIHPLKSGAPLQGDEARVYELVTRRFLACCACDALGFETTVDIEMAGEQFSSRGLMVRELNYLKERPTLPETLPRHFL